MTKYGFEVLNTNRKIQFRKKLNVIFSVNEQLKNLKNLEQVNWRELVS